jgi:hypothetical protein
VYVLSGERLCRFQAASTAAQISGALVALPVRGLRSNCSFLIFAATSMPRIVTAAALESLEPQHRPEALFYPGVSCSIRLFKYLLKRTCTRPGKVPAAFSLATVRCEAA